MMVQGPESFLWSSPESSLGPLYGAVQLCRSRVDFFSGVGKRALSSLLEGDSGVIIIIFSKS